MTKPTIEERLEEILEDYSVKYWGVGNSEQIDQAKQAILSLIRETVEEMLPTEKNTKLTYLDKRSEYDAGLFIGWNQCLADIKRRLEEML